LNRARKVGVKTHFWGGLATGFFFFSLYGYFTWAFFSGSYMITWKEMNDNTGKLYSSGDILACFLGIVYGVFSLGLAAPNVQSLTEGRVAGKMAFDVIDRLPSIPLNDPNALVVDPKKVQGNIEFRNVTFTYPTRPGQKILDNFSAIFEQGKTTALVGASGSGKSTIIQLIERFYDPDFGDVIIDGRNLRQINLKSLRQCIGYVG
jgi:ATP-binding cassette subfamily B (MDR/TAP) protein 1